MSGRDRRVAWDGVASSLEKCAVLPDRGKPLASIATAIKLSTTGRRLLAKHKTLSATLTVTTRAAGKPTKTVSRRVVIKSS